MWIGRGDSISQTRNDGTNICAGSYQGGAGIGAGQGDGVRDGGYRREGDAFIYDQMSTYTNWKNNPDKTRAILKPFQAEQWAIGIRQGNGS